MIAGDDGSTPRLLRVLAAVGSQARQSLGAVVHCAQSLATPKFSTRTGILPALTHMATSDTTPQSWQASMKRPKRGVPEGLWQRCPGCQATIFRKEAEKRFGVCPECDY